MSESPSLLATCRRAGLRGVAFGALLALVPTVFCLGFEIKYFFASPHWLEYDPRRLRLSGGWGIAYPSALLLSFLVGIFTAAPAWIAEAQLARAPRSFARDVGAMLLALAAATLGFGALLVQLSWIPFTSDERFAKTIETHIGSFGYWTSIWFKPEVLDYVAVASQAIVPLAAVAYARRRARSLVRQSVRAGVLALAFTPLAFAWLIFVFGDMDTELRFGGLVFALGAILPPLDRLVERVDARIAARLVNRMVK